jgi:hypothetical protein
MELSPSPGLTEHIVLFETYRGETDMSKGKIILGLSIMVAMMAFSAVSASAFWESNPKGSTTGKGSAGKTTFKDEGAEVTCEKAEGEWRIAASGAELILNVKSWNKCTAFGFVGATVKPCEFELSSAKGNQNAVGKVVTECLVTATGNCALKAPKTKSNENLSKVVLSNSGSNQVDAVAVTGITSEAEKLGGLGCVGVTNLKNKVGEETGTVTNEGVKAI